MGSVGGPGGYDRGSLNPGNKNVYDPCSSRQTTRSSSPSTRVKTALENKEQDEKYEK
jgi:hypothetical protein